MAQSETLESGLLSPRQLAQAIGVSESSLKRWCDKGHIPTLCTPGGHRRIPLSGALQFIRAEQHRVVCPELLGLPSDAGQMRLSLDSACHRLVEALTTGDETTARQIVLDAYLRGRSAAELCDRLMCPALKHIGKLWECGDVEVYQERRSCGICRRLLNEIRGMLPLPAANAPVAIGGTPAGDVYELPTTAVELALRERGWNAVSLGSSLPFATLTAAIEKQRPKLFWLSVSYLVDEDKFIEEANCFAARLAEMNAAFAIGGHDLTENVRGQLSGVLYCSNLTDLIRILDDKQLNPFAPPRAVTVDAVD